MSRRRARLLASAVLLVGAFAGGAPGHADVVGSGPDDSVSQAFGPMLPGVTYSGAFKRPDDVDHLFFDVSAGQSVHFTVRNTVRNCSSPEGGVCPVYGTLVTGAGQQVGGEGSSAGTAAVLPGATDVIDWTFPQGGRYYLAMDSGGDLETYSVKFVFPPAITSLRARSSQRGAAVRAVVRLGRAIPRLRSVLLLRRRTTSGTVTTTVGRLVRRNVAQGRRKLTVRLTPKGRALLARKGRLVLRLRVTATPGTAGDKPSELRVVRRVTLRP